MRGGTRSRIAWLGILLFVAAWLGALATRSLIGPDEGRYATLSLGMLQSGDWLVPRLNGLLYFEKPPLQYWGGAAAMALFGINEFAARLWPGLAGLATVFLLGTTAHQLYGDRAGLHALLVGGATTWIVLNSHFLSLDAGLCAALTLVLCAMLRAEEPARAGTASARRWMLAAWAGMALAVLSKGLVGIVIPGAALVLQSLWRRDLGVWRRLRWGPGLAIFLVIAAPWFVLLSLEEPGFAQFFFIHEHFQRYLTTVHAREGAWWYFVPYALVGLMPWTGALPFLLRGGWRPDFATAWLLAWAGFVFVFFSLSDSKLPSYILPIFPALVLLIVQRLEGISARALRRHLLVPVVFWVAVLVALPFAFRADPAATPAQAVTALRLGIAAGGLLFLAGAAGAWRLLGRDRVSAALGLVAAGHLLALLLAMASHDRYGQLKSSAAIVAALSPSITATTPVFAVQAYDQTLPFYLRRPVILVDYRDEFAFGEDHEPARWLPTLDAFIARWQREPQAAAYMTAETLKRLRERGLPMRVVFEDPRRVMVVKP